MSETSEHAIDPAVRRAVITVAHRVLAEADGMPAVPREAPCRRANADPEQWANPSAGVTFKVTANTDAWRRAKAAKLCAGCPVLDACLQWALDVRDLHSVLGGTTPEQRYEMLVADGVLPDYANQ